MWFAYMVRCADDSLYVGETGDLDVRLMKHNDGSASTFTANRRPVVLAYSESHATRETPLERERQIKRWTRAKKEALIANELMRSVDPQRL